MPRGQVDPNNVPIAGVDADGSGTIDAPLADGLTQMVFHDVNLTDGMGLDGTSGMAIPDSGR